MATKPSIAALWNTGGANNTAPTGPKIVLGFTNGERAASSYFNYQLKLLGEWTAYLSDGAFTGAHTFGSTVGITGAVTCSSTLGVTGAVTLSSTLAVTGLATLASLSVTGNGTVTGTLGVTGMLTATAGITVAVDQDVTLSGNGVVRHGDRQVNVAPRVIATTGSVAWDFSNRWWASTGSGQVSIAVDVLQGQRIKSVTIWRSGNSSCSITMDVIRVNGDATGTTTVLSSSDTPSSTWGPQDAVTPNWTIAGEAVIVNVTFSATGGKFQYLLVTYDVP